MKQAFHKIASFLMAFVVLFSTMSFVINMHYCGDTLVEATLFEKAKGCGMEMNTASIKNCSTTKKNCCNNKQFFIDGQDELQPTISNISLDQHVFITAFVHTYSKTFNLFPNKNASSFDDYKPPLVVRQIFKRDETYLI